MKCLIIVLMFCALPSHGSYLSSVKLKNGGYEGLVISIAETVPEEDCSVMLKSLELALEDASSYMHGALGGRAFLRDVTVLLPMSWQRDCDRVVRTAGGELAARADIRIALPHLLFPDTPWTQQSRGCGQPGDFISLAYTRLLNLQPRGELGRALVREWAKYRYGVFDEAGVPGDPVYPTCYHDEEDGNARVTGCTDVRLDTVGLCDNVTQLLVAGDSDILTKLLVHPEATSSIMFAHTAPQVTKFCDANTHNRYAPTKHNSICDRRSVLEVIMDHMDFADSVSAEPLSSSDVPVTVDTAPRINYKRETLTRYVLVIEDTSYMMLRESWSFLRLAVRKFAVLDLPAGSELGVVAANGTGAYRLQRLVALTSATRDAVASTLPYIPGDMAASSHANVAHKKGFSELSSCLHCGLTEALDMLEESSRTARGGSAATVVLVIAPGTGQLGELLKLSERARRMGTRITTINYPRMARTTHSPLDALAHATGGPAFTIFEKRSNERNSLLNTYFELTQSLLTVRDEFYQGDRSKLPVEIHRRELKDDGKLQTNGSFVVSPGLGVPSQFTVFMHNPSNPLVRSVVLISPSQRMYNARSDLLLNFKMLTLQAAINETGTWTYIIEHYPGLEQPYFVVVTATPRSSMQFDAPVMAKLWTSSAMQWVGPNSPPFALYVEVKQGDWPVLGAKVEVRVTQLFNYSASKYIDKFELLDTGSGDPDITRGDGVYSRYFTNFAALHDGLRFFQFEVEVTDNGNTAYTWQSTRDSLGRRSIPEDGDDVSSQLTSVNSATGRCCGSVIWPRAVRTLTPFQQILPPLIVEVGAEAAEQAMKLAPGHVADLRVQPMTSANDLRARLTWTAPGDHGDTGTVYRYEVRFSENLKNIIDDFESARLWEVGSPFPLAAGSETTFSLDMSETPELLDKQIFVGIKAFDKYDNPSRLSNVVRVLVPSLPRTPIPPELAYPDRNGEMNTEPSVVPRLAAAAGPGMILQVVLPVVAGAVVLAVCLGLYCVMVVHRRKRNVKEPPQASNTTIEPPPQQPTPYCGPPPNYEAEEKKLYCTLPPQDLNPPTPQISVIGGRTLSPYQSWTASQLLHEHERRHSPYGYAPHCRESPDEILQDPPIPPPPNNNSLYATNYRNTSFLSLVDESSIYVTRMNPSSKVPPPTLPKPVMLPFNPSLQGSLSSVSSDKKKRNVTMV